MYYILIKGNYRPGKNINHFLEWLDTYRDEQKEWGVVSAQVFSGWFGSSHNLTCLYGVSSVDLWSAGQDRPEGIRAIFAVDEILESGKLHFEVLKGVPITF